MKRFLITILILFSAGYLLAQDSRKKLKFGFEYSIERLSNNSDKAPKGKWMYGMSGMASMKNRMYWIDYDVHKFSIFYKQPVLGSLYIEPRVFYYKFSFDSGRCFSYLPEFTGFRCHVLTNMKENGIGGCLNIGYNIKLYRDFNLDLYFAPDLRYAMYCKSNENLCDDHEYFGHPLYKQHYFQIKGGLGLNYNRFTINVDYGKYLTKRLLIDKDCKIPTTLSIGLACKFL